MSRKLKWDEVKARALAREYLDLPVTGTYADRRRWYLEVGRFVGIEKLDPSEHERWVAEREIADALREFLREISQVHSFLKTRENELKTCRLSRIIFKNYQDALRKFLNGATDFQWDGFPEIVQAIKLLKLKRIARVSGENRTIVWGVGK